MPGDNKTEKEIAAMISIRAKLAQIVYAQCEPEIAAVCRLLEQGEQVSEQTLESLFDRLLEHCHDADVVRLYQTLSKAAVAQHPKLVQDYVRFYKEMWEIE